MPGFYSVAVCYTEDSAVDMKDVFYQRLNDLLRGISSRDITVCLSEFNEVSGRLRMPLDVLVCSGSIVVTTLDCGPRGSRFKSRVGANIL